MISFYPGPSKVYEQIPKYVKDAYADGVMSINHRSEEFMKISSSTISLLKEKLFIPEDYTVFFASSATECWEIITQSLIDNTSYHFFNGAFGEKWFEYTKKLHKLSIGYRFNIEAELKIGDMDLSSEKGMICITQNETSNGTRVSTKRIAKVRKQYPNHLIAVDATSSMGGVELKFADADVWYASVQKCFGLPAGMAVMICSPQAIKKALEINERKHYNSLPFMIDKMQDWQTTYTPNVLNIYLLQRVLQKVKPIDEVHKKLKTRLKKHLKTVDKLKGMKLLVKNPRVRSHTVVPVSGEPELIKRVKQKAKDEGFLLGNGYGSHKENTFRIANFPAIKAKEMKALHEFLTAVD
ncbi:alanine--glyoxylate aminotransferase family protein [Fulvivirga sp. RKSG066]|uniref:aminotransferase class V-fold PLP-dependent enzyme n=1 Tax=Fulvivirga aurantia TaxID=2529383 RepID=UPI0012BCE593|nr:aminotransferase class V-fold PLP-dependent enzyme [Fulvivirga aurantia]MTI21658.1 alanine--glyoxylate aminotransferase family protein [Fulvivirga aurantia]